MRYFRKSVLATPFSVSGTPISWEPIAKDTGIRAFDDTKDASIISALDSAADQRRGGISRISAEIYESLKKNRPLSTTSPSPLGVLGEIRVNNRDQSLVSPRPLKSVAAPVAVVPASVNQAPAPATIPSAEPPVVAFKPKRAPKGKVQPQKPEQV